MDESFWFEDGEDELNSQKGIVDWAQRMLIAAGRERKNPTGIPVRPIHNLETVRWAFEVTKLDNPSVQDQRKLDALLARYEAQFGDK